MSGGKVSGGKMSGGKVSHYPCLSMLKCLKMFWILRLILKNLSLNQ